MKLLLSIILGVLLSVATNLVSNFIVPHAERRKQLVISAFVGLVALLLLVAFLPDRAPQLPPMNPESDDHVAALPVGETWTRDGVEFTLDDIGPAGTESSDRVFSNWTIKNLSQQSVPVRVTTDSFVVTDNHGDTHKVIGLGAQYSIPSSGMNHVLQPGMVTGFWLAIEFDVSYSSARILTIVAHDIASISESAWSAQIGFE